MTSNQQFTREQLEFIRNEMYASLSCGAADLFQAIYDRAVEVLRSRDETQAELPEDQFARTAARYEKSLNDLHRKNEELEREIGGLIRKNARLTRDSALKTSAGVSPGELASDFARAATVENDGHGYTVWRIGGRQFVPLDEAQAALATRELTPETAAPIARSKSQLRRFSHMGAKQFTCAFCGSARDIAEALQVNASETDDSCWPSASIDFAERQPSPGEYVLLYFDELPYPVVGDHQAWSYKQGGFKAKRWLPLPKQRSERT